MLWLLSSLASAEENFILEIGEPVELGSAGPWIRVFPREDDWMATLGTNQSFYIGDLRKTGDDLEDWEMLDKRQIIDRVGLVDHGIQNCPDGTYFHVASARTDSDEMFYLWQYDSEFSVISSDTLTRFSGTHAHNDPNVLCSSNWKGIAQSIQGLQFQTDFVSLNDDLSFNEVLSLEDYPRGNGGGSLVNRDGDILYFGMSHGNPLQVNRYDSNWNFLEGAEINLVESPLRAYWAQGVIEVGDYYLLAHMAKDDAWLGSDKGDVFLAIIDKDLTLVESHRITTYEDGEAAMRPWIERKGDQALMSFDAFNQQVIVELKLNLEALGYNEKVQEGKACSCGEADAALFSSLFILSLFRRKR